MSTGERLKKIREYFEISQVELSKILKASQGVVSDIERGEKDISRNLLQKLIIRYPDININWLLSGKGNMLMSPSTIGERLAYFRQDRELSAEIMASLSDITTQEYDDIEKNKKSPSDSLLKKWRGNFNLSSDWILLGIGSMYIDPVDKHPERAESRKLITNEDDGELSWQQQFPDVFRIYQENKRLKDRVNGSGCSVCSIMRRLENKRQMKVEGYAEALLKEQEEGDSGE